jgi:hypothetical protein
MVAVPFSLEFVGVRPYRTAAPISRVAAESVRPIIPHPPRTSAMSYSCERDQLEAQHAAASIVLQRQRLQSVIDDWPVMTNEEKKRILQMLFSDIRADHTVNGLNIEFRAKPIWEPYVEAVLARQRQVVDEPPTVITSERKTGLVRINPPSLMLTAECHIHLLRKGEVEPPRCWERDRPQLRWRSTPRRSRASSHLSGTRATN